MKVPELLKLISNGETSKTQFKENVRNETSIAQEMVAFSNSKGGSILVGVHDKDWSIVGLTSDDLRRLDTLLSNAAQNQVKCLPKY